MECQEARKRKEIGKSRCFVGGDKVENPHARSNTKDRPRLCFVVVSFPMALPPTTTALEDDANWAVERATALPEFWALVAERGR